MALSGASLNVLPGSQRLSSSKGQTRREAGTQSHRALAARHPRLVWSVLPDDAREHSQGGWAAEGVGRRRARPSPSADPCSFVRRLLDPGADPTGHVEACPAFFDIALSGHRAMPLGRPRSIRLTQHHGLPSPPLPSAPPSTMPLFSFKISRKRARCASVSTFSIACLSSVLSFLIWASKAAILAS